jgi:thiol:disulfide interchange protein DsbD
MVSACAVVSLVPVQLAFAQLPQAPARTHVGRTATAPFVKVELIAASGAGRDGRLWLGVRFELEDNWHLYWQNPGDSGSPPEAQWQSPDGMRVGDFEWPAPERIDAAGLVNYGYHGTVVLPVPVTVAADAPATAVIAASLRWIVCRDMCVAGKAKVEITLPAPGEAGLHSDGWTAAIAHARSLVPQPAPPTWTARATSSRDAFEVSITTGQLEAPGYFFPLEAGQVNDSAPQTFTALPDGLRFRLRKSDQLLKDPPVVKGVVSLAGGRAFIVTAPVSR